MPKRKMPEPDPGAFERMARELECDETGREFERALFASSAAAAAWGSVKADIAKGRSKGEQAQAARAILGPNGSWVNQV